MNNIFTQKLKEIMANPTAMTLDTLKDFVQETVQYFQELQSKVKSTDPARKEEALKEALEIKALLEQQMAAISKMTGMSPEQMIAMAADSVHLSDDELKVIDEAEKKIAGIVGKSDAPAKPLLKITG